MARAGLGGIVLAVALALAPALALVASAQPGQQTDACRAPVLSFQPVPDAFQPGASTSLLFAIENPNGPPVEAVRATVTTSAPAGWTVTAAQRELTMGPQNVSVDVLAVTAPNRGTGAAAGNVTILVTFVCTTGDIQTSASAATSIEVRIQQFTAPWPVVLAGFLALIAGVAILGLRRLRRGVAITPSAPERTVEAGKSVKFTFHVENRRGRPQKLRFVASGLPEGWSIHLALEDVDLEPGEEKSLWAILRAPPQVQPGTVADVALRLEGGEGARDWAHTSVRARVVPPA